MATKQAHLLLDLEKSRDSIRQVQDNYFVQNIFNPAIINTDIPEENIEFLKKLKFYLEDQEYHASDGPLFAIVNNF